LGFDEHFGSESSRALERGNGVNAVAGRLTGGALASAAQQQENKMTDLSALEPAEYLMRMFDHVEFSYLVVVAVELGIADLLASGPRSIADLAADTGTDVQSTKAPPSQQLTILRLPEDR
jgi:hypothetical protein